MAIDKRESIKMFFSSDYHLGHARICEYANRPFATIEEHDATVISLHNEVVGPNDVVYNLGDVCFGGPAQAARYFTQMNGKIKVLGYPWHHDKKWLPKGRPTDWQYVSKGGHIVEILPPMVVLELKEFSKGGYPLALTLCHFPLLIWPRKHYGAIHAFGHSHGKTLGQTGSMDVGIDNAYRLFGKYVPFRLEKVVELLT